MLIGWRDAGLLLACYVVLTGVWSAVGWALVHPLDDTAIVRTDERVANWFVERRTPTLDDWSLVGSYLSETIVKIVVTAIIVLVLLWAVKRWLDPLVVAVSLILEAMVFITVTWIVARPRPNVERLDGSPVDSSVSLPGTPPPPPATWRSPSSCSGTRVNAGSEHSLSC